MEGSSTRLVFLITAADSDHGALARAGYFLTCAGSRPHPSSQSRRCDLSEDHDPAEAILPRAARRGLQRGVYEATSAGDETDRRVGVPSRVLFLNGFYLSSLVDTHLVTPLTSVCVVSTSLFPPPPTSRRVCAERVHRPSGSSVTAYFSRSRCNRSW